MSDQDMSSERTAEHSATPKRTAQTPSGAGIARLNLSAIAEGHSPPSPWDRLPETAEELLQLGFTEPAVVVAMTACETIVARAITVAFHRRGVPDLEDPVDDFVSSYSIATNPKVRKLYEALTGDDRLAQQPFWIDLVEAARARHKAVHEGARIDAVDARRFINTAMQAIAYIENANKLKT